MRSVRTLTEEQVFTSIIGGRSSTELSTAIAEADRRARTAGGVITVIRTTGGNLRLYTEYQMIVAIRNVESSIYDTERGFLFKVA